MLFFTHLSSLFFLLLLFSLSVLSHPFSPLDNYLFDCGSDAPTTTTVTTSAADHRVFSGDLTSNYSPSPHSHNFPVLLRNENPSHGLSQIYHTARIFMAPARYAFPIRDKGTHLVRLHFHAFDSPVLDLGRAQFQVLVNGYVVLSNFTRLNCTSKNPRILEYLIPANINKLVILFVPDKVSKLAFVNAIEVISAPKDLVPETAQYLRSSGDLVNFDGLNKHALEVVHRVNVGGPKVTPFNDSLWRTWVPDDGFFRSGFGSEKLYFGGRIKYQVGGASREVGPDNVYNSARLIRSKNDSVPNVNITWVFPIIGGYKYLVRLHFCDIASISLGLLYFNVYVNGYLAYKDLDLSYITNSLASPFYADFVVDGDGGQGDLSVSVGPSNRSFPHAVDGILNGVEVMKLNNSYGSLDGDVGADLVMKSWPSGNSGILVALVFAACIVLILYLLIPRTRRLIGSRESVPWSRLPVNLSDDNVKIGNVHIASK